MSNAMVKRLSLFRMQEKRPLELVALPFVHEGIIHAMYSASLICQDAPKPLEVA